MKVFNGRAAAEEYMSTHTLTFSSPEMILKKFVLWLGEQVNSPGSKEQTPRLILYIEDKGINDTFNLMPSSLPVQLLKCIVESLLFLLIRLVNRK
jgi:hypothetical protein